MNPSHRDVEPPESAFRASDTSQDEAQQVQTGYALVRMRTMIMLRWVTIIGQGATVLFSWLVLRVNLPVIPCLAIVAASALFNVALALSPASRRSAKPWELTAQLSFDVLILGGLFFLTGGVANPFLLFVVGPVTMASGSRWVGHAVFMTVLSIIDAASVVFRCPHALEGWPGTAIAVYL